MGLAMGLAAGCTEPATPAEGSAESATVAPVEAITWRLTGRVTPYASTLPAQPPFDGGKALLARCDGVEPCAAEQWTGPQGQTRETLWRGTELMDLRSDSVWPATWKRLDGSLAVCLGHPFFDPPAADPSARRVLVEEGDSHTWVLLFTGGSPCRLEGALSLAARGPEVNVGELEVDGIAFSGGGRALLDRRVREGGSPLPAPQASEPVE